MTNLVRALLVEHSGADSDLVVRELRKSGYAVEYEQVNSPATLSNALQKNWDIVISDYHMSNFNGHDALRIFKRSGLDCPFIIVSESSLDGTGAAVMAAGADDCVTRDNLERLVPVVKRELKQAEVRRQWSSANIKLQHIASHDPTTDLPNHALLREKIDYAVHEAKRQRHQLAVALMKINNFGLLNERLGDPLLDLLLMQLARRVQGALDPSLTFACLRSNEFGVLAPICNGSEDAVRIVQSVIKTLDQPFILGEGLKVGIQARFGIACFPEHATSPDLLLTRARAALATVLTNRQQYGFYSGEQYKNTQDQLSLVTELRKAIVQNELFLVYQLKLHLPTWQVTGVEALVRWRHPKLGILNPERFIGLAEQTGLIMPLTLWVLNEALQQCRAWNNQSQQLTVAINLSPWNLQSSVLPEQIRGLIASSGVSARQLELEITESALIANPTQAVHVLTAMKDIGLQLSVDDFGTGYSSLAHLHQLPIDAIKIDKSFVQRLGTESRNAIIVRSIIQMAHNLGLKVIAEGVETRETLRTLATMGCDTAQGYYISHPRPAQELLSGVRLNGL